MKARATTLMDGPSWLGQKLRARIVLTKHPKTAMVEWSAWEIDRCAAAERELAKRLAKAKTLEIAEGLMRKHRTQLGPKAILIGGYSYGVAKFWTHPAAEELYWRLVDVWSKAVRDLPTKEDFS